jgi:hypothetical protein
VAYFGSGQEGSVINPEAQSPDADLERQIAFQHGLMVTSLTPAEQTAAWEEMKRLIALRSPEMVAAMEVEMGIR